MLRGLHPVAIAAMLGLASSLAAIAEAQAADCPNLLHLHGYLTVAVVKCGFREARSIVNLASSCRTMVGHASATQTAADGIRFAQGEIAAKGGVPAWCGFAKSQYPSLLNGAGKVR